MTALAAVIAYLGTLACACFVLWFRTTRSRDEMHAAVRALRAEFTAALASPQTAPCAWDERRVKKLEDTVSVLAIGAGLRQKGPAEAPKG